MSLSNVNELHGIRVYIFKYFTALVENILVTEELMLAKTYLVVILKLFSLNMNVLSKFKWTKQI